MPISFHVCKSTFLSGPIDISCCCYCWSFHINVILCSLREPKLLIYFLAFDFFSCENKEKYQSTRWSSFIAFLLRDQSIISVCTRTSVNIKTVWFRNVFFLKNIYKNTKKITVSCTTFEGNSCTENQDTTRTDAETRHG